MTEKLLTYALGRGLDEHDMPAVRAIVRDAAARRLPVLVARARHRQRACRFRCVRRRRSVASRTSGESSYVHHPELSLPRRTFLRGMGATLALPLLDAMVPALTATAKTAASAAPRFGAVYMPNGAIMDQWTPADDGRRLRVHADPEAARAVPGARWSSSAT